MRIRVPLRDMSMAIVKSRNMDMDMDLGPDTNKRAMIADQVNTKASIISSSPTVPDRETLGYREEEEEVISSQPVDQVGALLTPTVAEAVVVLVDTETPQEETREVTSQRWDTE